ncbi:MAG: S41 family peptidase [Caloramator sp.]|nr:S41 family peptidase [Caloramator sp.]
MTKLKLKQRIVSLILLIFVVFQINVFAAGQLDEVKDIIKYYYVENVDESKLNANTAIDLIKSIGDPYSAYFTSNDFENFIGSINQSYVGIGVTVEKCEEGILITGVFDNSSAKQVGILPGDIIFEVNGVSISSKSLEEAITLIRGEEGTYVDLKIKRASEVFNFHLKRTKIEIATAKGELIDGHVGYISLTSFGENTNSEFVSAYNSLKARGADIFVLDIRNNGGGFLYTAVEILSNFIGDNTCVILKDKYGTQTKLKSDVIPNKLINDRFILLTNENSASASEILAAALKDYNKALIIGKRTYGKGTAQSFFELSNGDVIKLTTQKFYSPYGNEINKVGVLPHINVDEDIEKVALQLTAKEPTTDKTNYVKLVINGKNYYVNLKDEVYFNKLIDKINNADIYIGVKNEWIKKDLNYYKQKENAFVELKNDINNQLIEMQKKEIEQKKKEEQKNLNTNSSNQPNNIVPKKYGYVAISALNSRQLPTTKGKIMFVLKRNTKFEILGSSNGWYKIKYNNKIAYVYGKYVKTVK